MTFSVYYSPVEEQCVKKFFGIRELIGMPESTARRIALLLSAQPNRKDQIIMAWSDDYKIEYQYRNGSKIAEYKGK